MKKEILVGQSYVGVYTIVEELQKEQQNVDFQIEHIICSELQSAKKKALIDREKRIVTVVNDKKNHSVMDFLHGIAHNFTL